jgi:hypothetical protein
VRYDPKQAPRPGEWLALGESERLEAVLRCHKRLKVHVGSLQIHAAVHATVETQLAQGHEGATRALERLMADGLDRHEATHAIGSVLAEQIRRALQGRAFEADDFDAALATLDAASWRGRGEAE